MTPPLSITVDNMRFRRREGVVDAIQLTEKNAAGVIDWIKAWGPRGRVHDGHWVGITVHTGDEWLVMVLRPGDWIVREPDGALRRWLEVDFSRTYEKVVA